MITYDEMGEMLNDIVGDLPSFLTEGLSGGISLTEGAKPHPVLPFPRYVVMGEYINHGQFVCYALIFYGSVMTYYPDASTAELKEVLKGVVLHELHHHIEGRAGSKELENEDTSFVTAALSG